MNSLCIHSSSYKIYFECMFLLLNKMYSGC